MKKILKLISIILLISMYGCSVSEENLKKTHYINENFVLISTNEILDVVENNLVKIRIWTILRQTVENNNDSLEFAEIYTIINPLNNDTKSISYNYGKFLITDSLWYNKKNGDILYFKYIRKSRFYKRPKLSSNTKFDVIESNEESKEELNKNKELHNELELMELERQLMDIQRKINKIMRIKEVR